MGDAHGPQTVTGRTVDARDVDAIKRHHKRILVRDAREGRPTGPAESDLALAKSISIWNWNVEHSIKVRRRLAATRLRARAEFAWAAFISCAAAGDPYARAHRDVLSLYDLAHLDIHRARVIAA